MKAIIENRNRKLADKALEEVSNPWTATRYFSAFGVEDGGKKYQVSIEVIELGDSAPQSQLTTQATRSGNPR